jgi:hypothetical protein
MSTSSNDILPPLSLTIAVLTSLRNTSPTPSQDGFLVELQKLEVVLFRTSLLGQSVHSARATTLKEAAIHCRDAIIEFWERKILKGDGGMGENDWRMIGNWQDINWDACDEEDLANLEADLTRYKERLEELLASMSNSDGKSADAKTRFTTEGSLVLSQEELEIKYITQGVEGGLADLQTDDQIEESGDAELESPEQEVTVADSTG